VLSYEFMKKLFEEKSIVSKTISGQELALNNHQSILNTVLLILVIILGFWYALWSNFITSGQYRQNLLEGKLSVLRQENNVLLSEKSSSANLGALLVFSKHAGLVEQKNIEYLFDRRNVAEVPQTPAH